MPRYPSLFEINTRVWLNQLSRKAGKPITLADIDEAIFDGFAEQGFDWIWLLSVWQTGAAGQAVSRGNPQWRAEFKALLPDLIEDDICGSGFAITAYSVRDALGGDADLARFREKLARRGTKPMLDFVPNHTAPDHPWVKSHPGYYVEGSEEALAASPENYLRVETNYGPKILAYGRDPNFPGWPDTLQLNYANPEQQNARIGELITIAGALGKPVVTNPNVPAAMREALNLESGLNDGICVPIVVLFLGLAVGTQIEGGTVGHLARVVAKAIGIGLIVGLGLTWLTRLMLRFAERQGWISEHWVEIPIVALAAACFAAAQALGGSRFIACFVGGFLLSGLRARHKEELLRGAEHMGEALALLTWVVFGGIVVARMIDRLALLYAVLSLTVIRMLPVFLCLIGTRTSTADKFFIGWFGPRGLATIVFAVLVLDEKLPGNDTIILAAGWTVLLSVIAHGVTANPLVRRIATRPATEAEHRVHAAD